MIANAVGKRTCVLDRTPFFNGRREVGTTKYIVKALVAADRVDVSQKRVIGEILADGGVVHNSLNTNRREISFRTDTRQHEDLGCANAAC